ncbi:MAG: hypothetical protein JWM89_3224 [Acidimicrobiales bacterium]|nr:hypothetical protein [Acidimicrobiales bacterium]
MAAGGDGNWRAPTAIVVAVFVVSRVAYYLAGVRFLWHHAPVYLHFLDPVALKHHLLQSLWYDHAQPPGLNLVWGLALKVSPGAPDRVLWPLFLAIGLATSLLLLHLLKRVGLGARWAVAIVVAWTVSPTAILLETYLLYTPFEVFGVLAVALLFARWVERGRPVDLVALSALVAALGLTRATFHLVWIVGLFALAALLRRDRWRTAAVWSLLPILLVGGWYAKNQAEFGFFGPSSWMGNNLSRITVEQLPRSERLRLASDEGGLSDVAAYPAFATFAEMDRPPSDPPRSGPRGVQILDEVTRTGNSFPNQRNRGYLAISRLRLEDARWVIRHRPGAYLRGVGRASSLTFGLPADFFGYGPNVDHMRGLVTAERWVLGGWQAQPPPADDRLGRWGDGGRHEWIVLAAYLLALALVPVRWLRRRSWRTPTAADALVAVTWATVAYLTAVTIALDFGENNRFRSVTDPAVLVLLAWLVTSRGRHEVGGQSRVGEGARHVAAEEVHPEGTEPVPAQ